MYFSDEREIAFNILSFSFKKVYTVLETVSKSLHICVHYCHVGADSNALSPVSCI